MKFNKGKYELSIRGKTLCQKHLISCSIVSHENGHCIFPQNVVESMLEGEKYEHNDLMLTLCLQYKAVPILCTFDILPQQWETPQLNTNT